MDKIAICERLLTEWTNTYVILGSRDPSKGQQAVSDLVQSIGGNCQGRLELMVLDASSDESVRMAAQSFESKHGLSSLYGIINNAGVCNFVLLSFISLDDAVRSFTKESLSHLDAFFNSPFDKCK
jgi:NAD(P)-dependent dehydrogenase (short-subunit alcohol dehydrogenase family)